MLMIDEVSIIQREVRYLNQLKKEIHNPECPFLHMINSQINDLNRALDGYDF